MRTFLISALVIASFVAKLSARTIAGIIVFRFISVFKINLTLI